MELQPQDVQVAMAKLLNHYPESAHNLKTISRLSADWFDLLKEEGVTKRQFSAGMRHAVKTCRFFPKLVDVLDGVKCYREDPTRVQATGAPQISDTSSQHDLTPEEIARNKERIGEILKMLAGEKSMDETIAAVESKTHIKEFGEK
jgi:hypothetical protein